ncbi:nucleotidyltransferase domain-containing protein [Oryzibacter oryziterrae]|uniref:nucleotidyltransferase domain-containing protein n=1 Tax=Oryzibacter oryziterrae TaxID=2766474 RepID=UPI001F47C2DC|nr:nucleotidyltransferase domain-containing protein [Oryzibacter oryziterrae]
MSSAAASRSVAANVGIFANEQDALDAVVSRLVNALDPESVWLFGSRARGTGRPDSDFDILVVGKEHSDFDGDDYDRVYAPLKGLAVGVDVVPCDYETFRASLGLQTSLVRRIVDEGRLIYGAGT